jgi:hypothetical protein
MKIVIVGALLVILAASNQAGRITQISSPESLTGFHNGSPRDKTIIKLESNGPGDPDPDSDDDERVVIGTLGTIQV